VLRPKNYNLTGTYENSDQTCCGAHYCNLIHIELRWFDASAYFCALLDPEAASIGASSTGKAPEVTQGRVVVRYCCFRIAAIPEETVTIVPRIPLP
jgi:hypothetical protein